MRFWELVSVCRTEPALLERLSARSDWAVYLDWYADFDRLVQEGDREKLDAVVPDEACAHVLSHSRAEYFQSEGYIRVHRLSADDRRLTAVDVLRTYGGSFLEDVLEAGLAQIPP